MTQENHVAIKEVYCSDALFRVRDLLQAEERRDKLVKEIEMLQAQKEAAEEEISKLQARTGNDGCLIVAERLLAAKWTLQTDRTLTTEDPKVMARFRGVLNTGVQYDLPDDMSLMVYDESAELLFRKRVRAEVLKGKYGIVIDMADLQQRIAADVNYASASLHRLANLVVDCDAFGIPAFREDDSKLFPVVKYIKDAAYSLPYPTGDK